MPTFTLGVYRRLDNRFENQSDDSPRAFELHKRRQLALHDVFQQNAPVRVESWGKTDDTKSHEFVELAVAVVGTKAVEYLIVPGLKWLGEQLAEKLADKTLDGAIAWVVAKLRAKQQAKEILDFTISLPDGTRISVDPPDRDASIRIDFKDGVVRSIVYSKDAPENG